MFSKTDVIETLGEWKCQSGTWVFPVNPVVANEVPTAIHCQIDMLWAEPLSQAGFFVR